MSETSVRISLLVHRPFYTSRWSQ